MDQSSSRLEPAQPPPVDPATAESRPNGRIRRAVLTGAVSALLLVGGGVAAVSAASPAPSSAPSTTAPSGGTGTPRTHSGSIGELPEHGRLERLRQLGQLRQPSPGRDPGDLVSRAPAARFGGSPGSIRLRPCDASNPRPPVPSVVAGCTSAPPGATSATRRRRLRRRPRARPAASTPAPRHRRRTRRARPASRPPSTRPGSRNVSAFAFDADGRLWAATAALRRRRHGRRLPGREPPARRRSRSSPTCTRRSASSGSAARSTSRRRAGSMPTAGLDGTAFARHTTVLTLPAGVGEVNGLVMSPDGRLVLGVSAPCDACTPTHRGRRGGRLVPPRRHPTSGSSRAGSGRRSASPTTRAPTTCSSR